ncbi:MAG: Gldg family protein, partial [Alphaproteobacteria bacterium]|nr:Gldg family protein [Alphaproteobacteria bacterium]
FAPEREQYLEYDISSLIYRLSTPKKTMIAVLSSLPLEFGPGGVQAMMQGRGQPNLTYQELSQTYQTQMLRGPFTEIPKGTDVLVIVHPPALEPAQMQAIDQFVIKGGRALVFVDPDAEMAAQQSPNPYQPAPTPPSSDLPALFKAWGVGYDPAKVVGDLKLAQRVQTRDPMNPTALYPIWLHEGPDNFDNKDPVSANLQSLNLASVGALHPLKGATTSFLPLVRSSDQASLLDAGMIRTTQDPQALMGEVQPTGEKFVIAARITGPARSAFPQTAAVKSGNVNLIVMADSDIFDDRFWVHIQSLMGKKIAAPFADNAAFVLNAVENLSGSSDLISLRTRETAQRPFTVVRDLQARAEKDFQAQEKQLQQHLSDTQQRLHELQQGGEAQSGNVGLSAAQQAEVERFRRDLVQTRTKLRDVQHNLRKDIDALGAWLAFVNIALVPILVAVFAIGLAAMRRRRRVQALGL